MNNELRMIGGLSLYVLKNKEDALKKAGEDISEYIKKNSGDGILLLFSGGSALGILNHLETQSPSLFLRILAIFFHLEVKPPSGLTVAVLDERYDEADKNNNFFQLMQTGFYKRAKDVGASFIDTRVNGRQESELAGYFEGELRKWKKEHPNGKIIATAGVGADGHTSGIMPFPEDEKKFNELFEADGWVASYDASGKREQKKRITTTNTFLKNIDEIFVFISGEEKRKALENMRKDGRVAEIPARILKEIKGSIYTDIK
ncbi:6-phosphogluconolactonase [Candidatus Azambacteria bacterium]|nr:6-phosphogluconolactonase [Candidatus Azambacteria bacterium]